jgi:nucleoside-diphosphate-sugar epimerase
MDRQKIAAVTGASGFIGTHLVSLLAAHNFQVHCLDVRSPAVPPHLDHDIIHHQIDLSVFQDVMDWPLWPSVTHVFHLAGVTQRVTIAEFRQGNVIPTQNLLRVLKAKSSRLQRFLLVSSQAAAGPARRLDQPVRESDVPRPVEAYGRSKLEAEMVVLNEVVNLPVTIVRPGPVYGPGDRDFLQIFQFLQKRLAIYPANRKRFMSVIYVHDLVGGMLQAAEAANAQGEIYFLCDAPIITLQDLYGYIIRIIDKRVIQVNLPQFLVDFGGRLGDFQARRTGRYTLLNSQKIALSRAAYWICSSVKAGRDFNFRCHVPLATGLEETYHWYKEQRWLN